MYPHHSGGPQPPPNHQQWTTAQQHQEQPSNSPHHPQQPPNGAPNGYPPAPLPSIQYPQQVTQPAPRQRTAIACRYCRRRKIRCSGFENSEDGRCQNCTRFQQECVFTPVSAQTQAFVPAHTVYGRGGHPAGAQLYGAYGQPLPPTQPQDPYGRGAPQPYPVTSPTGPYAGPPPGYVPAPAPLDTRNGTHSRKRPSDEPHTPSLAPPPPGASRAEHDYRYPDPTTLAPSAGAVSPASSSASYHSAPQQSNQQTPYYTQPPSTIAHSQPLQARRPSPTSSAYNYDTSRASSSPHTHPQPGTPYGGDALRPPSNHPQSRTPPPVSTAGGPSPQQQAAGGPGGRHGMSISNLVSGQGAQDAASPPTRSTMDTNMVNKLGK
ncbi:hypothetical protein NA57DRAFT_76921 [Rhizodiscina lignyota]|uniref:Zn(2)-C6 fungal-type domain-containing protein n=1 Tax=Rhizodiscina lignyota TaxID=1504668 RepID=A0A9P4M4V6_9PEZI|nr:hypothetical protein NA57DRAFT_76921 [Rhizodiscina lignyota]